MMGTNFQGEFLRVRVKTICIKNMVDICVCLNYVILGSIIHDIRQNGTNFLFWF